MCCLCSPCSTRCALGGVLTPTQPSVQRERLNTQGWGAQWRPANGFRVHSDRRHGLSGLSLVGLWQWACLRADWNVTRTLFTLSKYACRWNRSLANHGQVWHGAAVNGDLKVKISLLAQRLNHCFLLLFLLLLFACLFVCLFFFFLLFFFLLLLRPCHSTNFKTGMLWLFNRFFLST